jgi:PKD repeat protein
MFTPDQSARFQTAMANAPFRKFLNASSATLCNVPAVAPTATFSIESTNCRDSLVKPTNLSTGSPLPSYVWSATPSLGVNFAPNASVANPSITFMYPGFYTVALTATNGAGNSSYSEYILVYDCADGVGIEESKGLNELIRIQPNPGTGWFTVQTAFTGSRGLELTVYNSLGQSVHHEQWNDLKQTELTLDLRDLPAGIYSVSMVSANTGAVKRLVITR